MSTIDRKPSNAYSESIINETHPTEENQIKNLSYFQASLFATILEDFITEARILAECNNELRMLKARSDMPLLLAIKFCVERPNVTDELDGVDRRNLDCMEYKLKKLDADRKLVTTVMIDTYKDLTVERLFTSLTRQINAFLSCDDYREWLQEDEAKNRFNRRELNKQLRQQRNHIKSVIYDADATIEELKTEVEDAQLYAECRSRYVENWQLARTEQHLQTIADKESSPLDSTEYYKQRADQEQRVHSEVEMLINIAINETLQKVNHWMDKYDVDMEGIDLKIQIKKNDYQNMLDKRLELEKTIERHDQLMKDWIEFKEEREKMRLYREKMTNSAIIVQAWWRGLLVRRQLGPYKVSKKKGGAGKKK